MDFAGLDPRPRREQGGTESKAAQGERVGFANRGGGTGPQTVPENVCGTGSYPARCRESRFPRQPKRGPPGQGSLLPAAPRRRGEERPHQKHGLNRWLSHTPGAFIHTTTTLDHSQRKQTWTPPQSQSRCISHIL
ncbi:hypothetical protein AAFF_G00306680 [Aldrovandia affinis]|uniref:Uncharacterized protein n=1 Tax=Aldrovandia affinis TaxID=143900 RepID=A0AAD7R8M6_9TELE|nr:hypothetical protein AAFF_G00306680 [Aldrovandia affinis]